MTNVTRKCIKNISRNKYFFHKSFRNMYRWRIPGLALWVVSEMLYLQNILQAAEGQKNSKLAATTKW